MLLENADYIFSSSHLQPCVGPLGELQIELCSASNYYVSLPIFKSPSPITSQQPLVPIPYRSFELPSSEDDSFWQNAFLWTN